MSDHQHSCDRISSVRKLDRKGALPSNINKFGAQCSHALYTIEQVLETLEKSKGDEAHVMERWGANAHLSCSRREVFERPPYLSLFR